MTFWFCNPLFGVVTRPGHGREASCRDMESMLRQGQPFRRRDTALGVATGQAGCACRDRHRVTGHQERATAHSCVRSVRTLCTRPTCYSALCCALFINTVHRVSKNLNLVQWDPEQKKKYKMNFFLYDLIYGMFIFILHYL